VKSVKFPVFLSVLLLALISMSCRNAANLTAPVIRSDLSDRPVYRLLDSPHSTDRKENPVKEHDGNVEDLYIEERFILSYDLDDYRTEVIVKQAPNDGKTALIMAGAHGNEPGGYLALLDFIKNYRPNRGIMVILPLQNPVARKKNTRSSAGPVLNNYYNFSRAFPAKNPVPERDKWIWSQFKGVNDSWWWYAGDQKLTENGIIPLSVRQANTIDSLLDEEGYRKALDPQIKMAAQSIYKLMLGEFPDGSKRYDQIDILIDMHEAAWFYQDVLCADDNDSRLLLETVLPEINRNLQGKELSPVTVFFSPIPTSPAWTARYELPEPALAVTTETDRRLAMDKRLSAQTIYLEVILNHLGFELVSLRD
jgi:hypothetical protein